MVKLKIQYVRTYRDRHGVSRVEFRRRGYKGWPLRGPVGSPAFWKDYHAAKMGDVPPGVQERAAGKPTPPASVKPGSLRWLCTEYTGSAAFKKLEERTQMVRKRILERLCDEKGGDGGSKGDKPFTLLRPRHLYKMQDEMAETPEAANGRVKALRQVYKFALKLEYVDANPAREVAYLPSNNPDGFHTWTAEEVEQFEDKHPPGTKAHLALNILMLAAVRRSDAVRLGQQMEQAGRLIFTEIKGHNRRPKHRDIPILPVLRDAIDACPSGHLVYLTTAFNKPFTANGFGNWFRKRCDEAGLPHCTAHGLRKTGATIAAENGATEHQLMAIYEWDSPKQAALYTKKANRKRLVNDAMHLIVPDKKATKVSNLPNHGKKVRQ